MLRTLDVGSSDKNFCRGNVCCDIKTISSSIRPEFFVRADAHNLPFRDNVFEKSFSYFCFEHLCNPEKAMQELMRVGKDSFFATDSFFSLFLWTGATHIQVWFCGRWHSLKFFRPYIIFLSGCSRLWQRLRPSKQAESGIYRTMEYNSLIDCKTRLPKKLANAGSFRR